ncbi:MAG: gabD [Sphingomonas bacterium]|uniref:NAD-dependent succinate-semialdehyde dehydrogenase n=1 Tax=Sphingomonas bacterium TaxID=1895847 RepID=UPI0026315898|nr:NAD-dependent succinate-semialdehyde dehydrogenase [Sphingomonas bacterium]MDB5707326.1 gabD [Sphingomonas bacterium]
MIVSINPATGAETAQFAVDTPAQVDATLARAAQAQRRWRTAAVEERTTLLRAIAATLRARKPMLARLITGEMGKPIGEAEGEVEKCAFNCDFYADAAPAMIADMAVPGVANTELMFDPLGVVLAIMPWNYPLWQVFRFVAPALAAGNGVILKHAANVTGCARAIAEVIAEAGCPAGLFGLVVVEPDQIEAIIADPRIAAVTLTGSTQVGMIVASQAGRALKKQVLELGGSDPFIILADADLDHAARMAVVARFTNAGQSCVNAKRFIVEAAVMDGFVERFVDHATRLKLGDPLDRATTLGPLARDNLRAAIDDQVRRSVAAGARLLTGGAMPNGPGFFYPPTLLGEVTPGMAAFDEETFGPAAAIVRAADAEDAIELANRTAFGLGASLWTADLDRARGLVRRIDAGAVFVNAVVASDPRVPFGGIKQSGYGRELGAHGLREFTNMKTVRIDAAPALATP